MNKTVTVILPVYNEAQVILDTYHELKKVLTKIENSYRHEILFVADRSKDDTEKILVEIAANDLSVKVLVMSARFGHQMALLAGIDNTNSDVLIMMDSDGQHPPSLIPLLLKKYEEGYDIVETVRTYARETNFVKRLFSWCFYASINLLSDVPIRPGGADFRLISQRVAKVFRHQIRERNQFLRGLFVWIGFNSTTVSFANRPRISGRTKYSFDTMFTFAGHGLVSFSKKPLKAAILLGCLFSLLGFGLSILAITQFLLNYSFPLGWTTLATLIPLFSGIQLIFLGIIGEYIGAIFDEVKSRPHYVVDKRINFLDRIHDL